MSENRRFPDVFFFVGGVSKWIEELPTRVQSIYLFKVDNRNFRKRREICSKLTIKAQRGKY